MSTIVTFDALATSKAIAHALKTPSRACCGVFIGAPAPPSDAAVSSTSTSTAVTDCVPLFHGDCTTSPYFEIALEQVEAHAKAHGKRVVGAYYAPARREDAATTPMMESVAQTLKTQYASAFLVVMRGVDLEAFASGATEEAFTSTSGDDGRRFEVTNANAVRARVRAFVRGDDDVDIVDFDDHFDELAKDWRNTAFVVAS